VSLYKSCFGALEHDHSDFRSLSGNVFKQYMVKRDQQVLAAGFIPDICLQHS